MVLAGDGGQRITVFDLVIAPPGSHVHGNGGDGGLVPLARSGGQIQGEALVLGSGQPQQAGIQLLQVVHRGIHALSHQPQVHRIVDGDLVHLLRRFGRHVSQPVLPRILQHDGFGQDDGNVVPGLLRQDAAAIKLPEIGIAGALHRMLHGAGAGIVGGHRQIPVAELFVQVLQVARRGQRWLSRDPALIHPPVPLQAVQCARTEP